MWTDSLFYPVEEARWKPLLVVPGWVLLGTLFYLGCVSGGFWWIAGIKPGSILMGLCPIVLVLSFLASAAAGFLWRAAEAIIHNEPLLEPGESFSWRKTSFQGFQLIIFYGSLGLVLYAATVSFYPYGLVIPAACLLFYPLFLIPVFVSAQYNDRSLLGLLGGLLDTPHFLDSSYLKHWFSSTVYILFVVAVVGPALAIVLGLSLVGIFFLPGLAISMAVSCMHHLYHTFYNSTVQNGSSGKGTGDDKKNPFYQHAYPHSVKSSGNFHQVRN